HRVVVLVLNRDRRADGIVDAVHRLVAAHVLVEHDAVGGAVPAVLYPTQAPGGVNQPPGRSRGGGGHGGGGRTARGHLGRSCPLGRIGIVPQLDHLGGIDHGRIRRGRRLGCVVLVVGRRVHGAGHRGRPKSRLDLTCGERNGEISPFHVRQRTIVVAGV